MNYSHTIFLDVEKLDLPTTRIGEDTELLFNPFIPATSEKDKEVAWGTVSDGLNFVAQEIEGSWRLDFITTGVLTDNLLQQIRKQVGAKFLLLYAIDNTHKQDICIKKEVKDTVRSSEINYSKGREIIFG